MDILVLDGWFFVQLANFLIILVVLNAVLIAPVRRMLKLRADTVAAQASEIDAFTSSAEGKIKNYHAALEDARRDASAVRTGLRLEGVGQEKAILDAANEEAFVSLKGARATVANESKVALETMLAGVSVMANKAVSKVLGKAL
ncbi:MAG: ATP synthase F0 subunit B [Acidobacteriota bacterium]